jgi:hypothetical protein
MDRIDEAGSGSSNQFARQASGGSVYEAPDTASAISFFAGVQLLHRARLSFVTRAQCLALSILRLYPASFVGLDCLS